MSNLLYSMRKKPLRSLRFFFCVQILLKYNLKSFGNETDKVFVTIIFYCNLYFIILFSFYFSDKKTSNV